MFLGKVFRHVLQLYATLDQFSAVELVLVKILAVQKSKYAHWRIFFKVSESLLMVFAKTCSQFTFRSNTGKIQYQVLLQVFNA